MPVESGETRRLTPENLTVRRVLPACIAEFLGTFALVFFGVGSIILTHATPNAGASLVTVALAHGLVLSAVVTAFAAISGAQFNPAVSIGLIVAGRQKPARAIVFIGFQLLAAACAAGLWQMFLSPAVANHESCKLGATIGEFTAAKNETAVLGIEAVLTFFLMISVLMGTVDSRAHRLGGFTIGLTVAACIMAAGPLTGASMNPARTFGPALCGRHWDMWWVYWVAPILGAGAAGAAYRVLWDDKKAGR